MKKSIKKSLALVLALAVLTAIALTGCGNSKSSKIQIAVPNDTTNEADGAGITATKNDIVENPHNVEIVEAEAAQIPNVLKDVDYAVINSNYAINAGLNPVSDSLLIEGSSSAYGNVLVTKQGNENSPKILALAAALKSKQVANFISDKYNGSVISVVENPGDGYDPNVDYDALKDTTITIFRPTTTM